MPFPFIIIVFACSIVQEPKCVEVELPTYNYFTCIRSGQIAISKWQKKHPNYHAFKWVCDPRQLRKA